MIWRKVKESNPRDALLGLVFKTSCAPPRATFRILAGTPRFEPRTSGLESEGLPLAYAPGTSGACDRTRTYEGQSSPLDLQSSAIAAQPHMRKKFQISNSRFQIKK